MRHRSPEDYDEREDEIRVVPSQQKCQMYTMHTIQLKETVPFLSQMLLVSMWQYSCEQTEDPVDFHLLFSP